MVPPLLPVHCGYSMKISIVTVVYNNPLVGDALCSILSQRLNPGDELELVVIDGGSTDGTLDVIERFRGRLGAFVSERDKGIYDAMNKGLQRATGEVIGTLNADDLYQDDLVLAAVLEAFRMGKAQVVYGDLVYVRGDDPSKVLRYWKSMPYVDGLYNWGWMPPHPTFFVRRQVYEQHGNFDLAFSLASDFELTMRFLAKAHVRSHYIPKVFVRMRMGGATNNSIRNIVKGNLESYRACKKNGLHVSPFFIVRKILSRIPQFFMKPSDASQINHGQ